MTSGTDLNHVSSHYKWDALPLRHMSCAIALPQHIHKITQLHRDTRGILSPRQIIVPWHILPDFTFNRASKFIPLLRRCKLTLDWCFCFYLSVPSIRNKSRKDPNSRPHEKGLVGNRLGAKTWALCQPESKDIHEYAADDSTDPA